MISVAGGKPPSHLHGRVILGESQGPEPEFLYHGRDRMDERYDMIRGVRNHQYLYVRNFESHRPWVQFMRTPSQGPIYRELDRLKRAGTLGPLVAPFMRDSKPFEELYDLAADPHQVFNLAADGRYRETLAEFRAELRDWMLRMDDKGLVPEPELYRRMYPNQISATTEVPLVTTTPESDGSMRVSLQAQTAGASLAYRIAGSESGGKRADTHWLLYTGEIRLGPGLSLQAISARLGFENSAPVTVTN